jgi:hypothetical protein
MSIGMIENGIEIFRYLKVHLEVYFVIYVVKKILVVVKAIHLVDAHLAFTHEKIDLFRLCLAKLVFYKLSKLKKYKLDHFKVYF